MFTVKGLERLGGAECGHRWSTWGASDPALALPKIQFPRSSGSISGVCLTRFADRSLRTAFRPWLATSGTHDGGIALGPEQLLARGATTLGQTRARPEWGEEADMFPSRVFGWLGRCSVGLALVSVVGCAPTLQQTPISQLDQQVEAERQKDVALEIWLKRQARLEQVAWRVSRSSAELCSSSRPALGLAVHNIDSYGKDYQAAATRRFGLDKRLLVRSVVDSFPAQEAGLRAGDEIVEIGDRRVEELTVAQFLKLLGDASSKLDSVRVGVKREGVEIKYSMHPVQICNYPANVTEDDAVNAYADGSKVFVTTGMIRFAETDDELALVVGHEIAHNALGHIAKKRGNAFLGALVDAAVQVGTGINTGGTFSDAAAMTFSQEFESEADYEGLYMAARAGYDISNSAKFWRRMAAEHPGSIKRNFMASHPSTPERFLRLEKARDEIDAKKSQNQALVPNGLKVRGGE